MFFVLDCFILSIYVIVQYFYNEQGQQGSFHVDICYVSTCHVGFYDSLVHKGSISSMLDCGFKPSKNLKGCHLETKNTLQIENWSLGFIKTLHKQ